MTFPSLALRVKEVRDLQKEYFKTHDLDVLSRLKDMEKELDRLIYSVITSYQERLPYDFEDVCTDADQYGV